MMKVYTENISILRQPLLATFPSLHSIIFTIALLLFLNAQLQYIETF